MTLRPALPLVLVFTVFLAGCLGDDSPVPAEPESAILTESAADPAETFDTLAETLIEELLVHSPEWAIRQGRYEHADRVTIPDAEQRERDMRMARSALDRLAAFDADRLPAAQRTDLELLRNRFEAMIWYQTEFRDWAWMPSRYNVAGVLAVILNTDFAPEDDRLRIVLARLDQVPAYYQAAAGSIDRPTLEHTRLAITQNRGGLSVLGEDLERRVEASGLDEEEKRLFEKRLAGAREAIEHWIAELERIETGLSESGTARPFRIGAELYEAKFGFDIQSDFSASELYQRALAERDRLHDDMDQIAIEIWPTYFGDDPMPENRLERIGRLIDHLSDRHVALEEFVPEIRRQIPLLEAFVREHDLLDQDPDKPLVVRETPEYMRGTGAIASVSAPGPFNPGAETFYNVTPLETFGEELAASYLREYNHWILQVLNIHEAIPGHYTQLLHANRSPSLVKSLFGNGAMIEGWAVYAERMMLEEGWGDHEPEMWLMYGKWALRVVHNAILDYAVHVLGLERDEAIRMMRDEAFQEVSEATQKWQRITLSQVQLTSYFAGYAEIYDLRERIKAEQGEDFSLRDFHNEFLSYGSAPVAVIAELMTGSED